MTLFCTLIFAPCSSRISTVVKRSSSLAQIRAVFPSCDHGHKEHKRERADWNVSANWFAVCVTTSDKAGQTDRLMSVYVAKNLEYFSTSKYDDRSLCKLRLYGKISNHLGKNSWFSRIFLGKPRKLLEKNSLFLYDSFLLHTLRFCSALTNNRPTTGYLASDILAYWPVTSCPTRYLKRVVSCVY